MCFHRIARALCLLQDKSVDGINNDSVDDHARITRIEWEKNNDLTSRGRYNNVNITGFNDNMFLVEIYFHPVGRTNIAGGWVQSDLSVREF